VFNVLTAAQQLCIGNLSVIPIHADGTKAPLVSWKDYQARCPTHDELTRWFGPGHVGLAVIAGQVSGNLEVLDFDAPEVFGPWAAMVQALCPGLLRQLPLVQTPTDGRHVYYRCPQIAGNQKLAVCPQANGRPEVLIETRGEGGYVIAPPSPADCHPLNRPYVLLEGDLAAMPTITPEERMLLLNAARAFNTYVKPECIVSDRTSSRLSHASGERPGDVFNARAEWPAILQPHGWSCVGQHGEVTLWKRPCKRERGISATTNYAGSNLLYVFSTNAWPFEPETAYSKFAAYALLEHGGGFAAAAKALSHLGYSVRATDSGTSGGWSSHSIIQPGRLRVREVRSSNRPAIRTIPAKEVPAWRS